MLRRFLLTLLSSWIVNPLGILVAQWFGVANASVVILVLLATGACVPFQLLMNECIAATESRGQAHAGRFQIGLLLSVQAVACAATIYGLSVQRFPAPLIAVVVMLLAINTWLSYRVSLRYYRLVTQAVVSMRAAGVIGIIPGITSLLLYLLYALTTHRVPQTAAGFIVAGTVLPSLVQWRYLQTFPDGVDQAASVSTASRPRLAAGWLLASALALAALAAGSTRLREMVAHLSANHVALLLVALNSMLSLINTLTRAAFINRAGSGQQRPLGAAAMTMAIAGATAATAGWEATPLIALIATQLAVAWVIEAARRMPVSLAIRP
ncbi:hypothetical protein [Pseudaquabacterium rugosum]|uniref:Polysaccharide biosynthesis protein n=1 Tax=Pseudaquabacterium rugosum TaxID=2984194 RepID=A0ABU9B4L3_9BURK